MGRCRAVTIRKERCRRQAPEGETLCALHRRARFDAAEAEIVAGFYEDFFDEETRALLQNAAGNGLSAEAELVRVLIRRALAEGKPASQVAELCETLARLLKTQHALQGKNVRDLDQALGVALDAIAREMGEHL